MKILLASLALGLIAVLVLQWGDWPPPPIAEGESSTQATAEQGSQPRHSPLDLLEHPVEKEEYGVVTERPLFMPDRRPPTEDTEEPEEELTPAAETELARLDLSAVVITPAESTAWVRDPTKTELLKLRLGDDLEGWTVKEIRGDELELERQGETDTIVLRDYKNNPPPVARPPRQMARQPARQPARTTTTHGGERSVPANRPNSPRNPAAGRP